MRHKPTTSILTASLVVLTTSTTLAAPAASEPAKHVFTVDDMLAMRRISTPEVSPDQKWVAFTVRDTDFAANRGRTDLWLAATDGSAVSRLTSHPDGDSEPHFSPDGRSVYFLSTRSGSSQVWRISPRGGEAEQVTKLPIDVGGFLVFPDGVRLLLALEVYPDLDKLEATVERDAAKEKDKVKARAYDRLLFRHWDSWEDGKRSHLFVWSPTQPDAPADLMRALDADVPTRPFGGMEEVAISPDGKWVAFTAKVELADAAWSTNMDVYVTPADGKGKATRISEGKGWDGIPAFSPDGKTLAHLSMERPMYESDRTRVVLFELATKKRRSLTDSWDRSPSSITWSKDGRTIYTSADHLGNHGLFAIDTASGQVKPLLEKGWNRGPQLSGDRLLFERDTLSSPVELFTIKPDGSDLRPLTKLNHELVSKIAWAEYEQFSFKGAGGDTVYGYAMRPVGLKGKAPVVMIVHGGPQGSMGDHFHYRWNPQAFAGRGFGVVFVDFHGSTGYGQKFTDAIRGDWGGAPYEDVMRGLDHALAKYAWMDATRVTAAGASYGGYMINWINGHTDRFKALVCHDGNLDERFAYFDTEELWFPEYEHGGTPWDAPEGFSKHNPIDHVKSWKTPTLVIHGSLDFRVTENQGMSTFTALQRKSIPSRLLVFPDENHWVLKPQNSKRWHDEVLGWLEKHVRK